MAYHDEYLERISAAVDGALSPAEREELEVHLAQCPDCKALYEDMISIHAVFADLPDMEAPEGLAGRIMAAVEEDNVVPLAPLAAKRASQPWRRWGAVAALLAVVLLGRAGFEGWLFQTPKNDETIVSAQSLESGPAVARVVGELAEDEVPATPSPLPTETQTAPVAAKNTVTEEQEPPVQTAPPVAARGIQMDQPDNGQPVVNALLPEAANDSEAGAEAPTQEEVTPFAVMARSMPTGEEPPALEENGEVETAQGTAPAEPAESAPTLLLKAPASYPVEEGAEESAPSADTIASEEDGDAERLQENESEETLTPREALELVVLDFSVSCLPPEVDPEAIVREDIEEEDGTFTCTLSWTDEDGRHNATIYYLGEQEQEPGMYVFPCSYDNDGHPFAFWVDKQDGTISNMCLD